MTVVVVHIQVGDSAPYLFGVFESREKYLQEIKPHLERKGYKGPIVWEDILVGNRTLTAEEVELNHFQDSL